MLVEKYRQQEKSRGDHSSTVHMPSTEDQGLDACQGKATETYNQQCLQPALDRIYIQEQRTKSNAAYQITIKPPQLLNQAALIFF